MEKWRKWHKSWGENAQQAQLCEERKNILLNPQNRGSLLSFTQQHKNGFLTIEEWRKVQEIMKERELNHLQLHERAKTWMKMGEEWISRLLLAPKSKTCFFKMGGLPNSNLTSIPFPSQVNNFLNRFLEEINDWHKKKMGGWDFDGLSLRHLAKHCWLKGLNYFPPIP